MRILYEQRALAKSRDGILGIEARTAEPLGPVPERTSGDGERDLHGEAHAGARGLHAGPRKEGQVRSRASFGVGIEKVVGVGGVLIDAALDEAHPHDAGVELDVLLRVTRDAGDMVKTGNAFHELRGQGSGVRGRSESL
jgi:hypothetical protein